MLKFVISDTELSVYNVMILETIHLDVEEEVPNQTDIHSNL